MIRSAKSRPDDDALVAVVDLTKPATPVLRRR